jgi:acetylornithine deacetylase/succinyl-diaminopimelate desuccinylase-like protein
MNHIRKYLATHETRHMEQLFSLLRIPSISPGETHAAENRRCAELLRDMLANAGATHAELIETKTNPLVYAEYSESPELPTLLIYGHYDVMPAERENGWSSPPFEPEIRHGAVYARGAEDNKGQIFMQLLAFEYLRSVGPLGCNLRFLYEGEEEMGSIRLREILPDIADRLRADGLLICDTHMISPEQPALVTGIRGMLAVELEVSGPSRDLHSGMYGGAVVNPANVLTRLLADLKDSDGKITIPDFYRDVIEYDLAGREAIARMPFDRDEFMAETGVSDLDGEAGYSDLERKTIRPTFDINGLKSGYSGEGIKAIVPRSASAKISFRLVPDQDPDQIFGNLESHLRRMLPSGVSIEIRRIAAAPGMRCSDENPAIRAAHRAANKVFGAEPVHIFEGGALPVVVAFKEVLGLDSVMFGFGLSTDNIHGADEHLPLDQTRRGAEAITQFVREFARGS